MTVPTDSARAMADIRRARAWARNHFPTEGEDRLLAPPKFDIEFPDLDRMVVYPRTYGHRTLFGVKYRLKWVKGEVGWEALGVLSGRPVCWLRVTDNNVEVVKCQER